MYSSLYNNRQYYVFFCGIKNFRILKCRIFTSTVFNAKMFEEIPGPKSLPVIGTLYQYLPFVGEYRFDKLQENGLKKFLRYGPVVREEIIPGVTIVWLFKPEDIETMFRCEGKYPQRRSHLALEKYRLDRKGIYNNGGLIPTNGPEWWRIRSVFQKGLSSPVSVLNFLPSSNIIIQEFIERIDERRLKNIPDFLPELSRLFLELTCMAALDLRLDSFSPTELQLNSRSSKLIQAALITNSCILKTDNGLHLWKIFETPLYRKLRKAQEYMEEVAIDLLSLKMSLFSERDTSKPSTLLEIYLASPELDFKDIVGMICDFLLAGIDTTTYTTSFILYYLATNANAQEQLNKEARSLLATPHSPVTKDVLNQAQYSKAVLKESLRLRPVSVGVGRILDRDAEFSGYNVPKGTFVVSQNEISCRLKQYFEDPNKFKPERWLKNHPLYKQSHPFLLLPFGHGPRSCIARRLAEQNMLILLLKMARNFNVTWCGSELNSRSLLINKPDGSIALNFKRI